MISDRRRRLVERYAREELSLEELDEAYDLICRDPLAREWLERLEEHERLRQLADRGSISPILRAPAIPSTAASDAHEPSIRDFSSKRIPAALSHSADHPNEPDRSRSDTIPAPVADRFASTGIATMAANSHSPPRERSSASLFFRWSVKLLAVSLAFGAGAYTFHRVLGPLMPAPTSPQSPSAPAVTTEELNRVDVDSRTGRTVVGEAGANVPLADPEETERFRRILELPRSAHLRHKR
jgi:hypothetical protein